MLPRGDNRYRECVNTSPLLPGTRAHQALLRSIVDAYAADERVLAVGVLGSLGRGTWDEWSDLDLDVVAYYHSHTRTEARPSPTDIRLARDPSALWVLVSLSEQPAVRAWRIHKTDPMDEQGDLVEVPLS